MNIKKDISEEIEFYRNILTLSIENLQSSLERTMDRVKQGKMLNVEGEIQAQAGKIDTQCARLATLMHILETLNEETTKK
jgi:hypothetical protein